MKKPIYLALASVLSLSMAFSGCAQSKTSSSSAKKVAQSQDLKVEIWDRGDSISPNKAEDNPVTKWVIAKVKKDLNINLTYVPIPRSQEVDKLNVMMAGGTAPDLIMTYRQTLMASFGSQGGLTDLSAYINSKDTPNITKDLKAGLQYGVIDGKQYAVPSKRVDDSDKHTTYVNETLLKKYNLTAPTTKEDLYKDCVAIKKAEPKVTPYAMAAPSNDVKYYENFIMSYAKYADQKELAAWNVDDCRLLSPGTENGYKEMNKWYNEGLITKDFALDTKEKAYTSALANGTVFSFTSGARDIWSETEKEAFKANGSKYIPILCFQNDKGEYANHLYNPIGVYNMVPKKSESHAEAAVKYINWLADPANYNTIRSGAFVNCGSKNSDGVYVTDNDKLKAAGVGYNNIADLCVSAKSAIEYDNNELYKKSYEVGDDTADFKIDDIADAWYKLSKPKGSFVAPYCGVPGPKDSKNAANVTNAIKSMAARVITCSTADFDATFKKESAAVDQLGLKDIIAEREANYTKINKK